MKQLEKFKLNITAIYHIIVHFSQGTLVLASWVAEGNWLRCHKCGSHEWTELALEVALLDLRSVSDLKLFFGRTWWDWVGTIVCSILNVGTLVVTLDLMGVCSCCSGCVFVLASLVGRAGACVSFTWRLTALEGGSWNCWCYERRRSKGISKRLVIWKLWLEVRLKITLLLFTQKRAPSLE